MKKIIRTISLFFVLILVFALPCFANSSYGSTFIYPQDDISKNFGCIRPSALTLYTSRPLDTYSTYNVDIYFYVFSSKVLNNEDIVWRSDFSDFSFSFLNETYTPFFLSKDDIFFTWLFPLQPADTPHVETLSSLFSSDVVVQRLKVSYKNLPFQSVIDNTENSTKALNSYYRPWLGKTFVDGAINPYEGLCTVVPSQQSIFNGYAVKDNNVKSYVIPVSFYYTFNSRIAIPTYDDISVTTSSRDFFSLAFNSGLMETCYAQNKYWYNSSSYRYSKTYLFNISPSNDNRRKYLFMLFNTYKDCPLDSPYSEYGFYYKTSDGSPFIQSYIDNVYLCFQQERESYSNFNYFRNCIVNSKFGAVVIPCDASYLLPKTPINQRFYDSIYKSTSFSLFIPAGTLNDGNINIDYSSYMLDKENWWDFGKDIYNLFVWLIFNIPLLNNITSPLFMLLNNFIGAWSALVLPLTTLGLVGAFFLFCFIYKTIKKLIGG